MASSGVHVEDVQIEVTCPHEDCGWHGIVDATIDPEDLLNGMDAAWRCPGCGRFNEESEGTW